MLLTFSLKNYGPYRDENTLDLRAARSIPDHPYNLAPLPRGGDALKVAVLYGANASGKSRLLSGLATFRRLATGSFGGRVPGRRSGTALRAPESTFLAESYNPFRLSEGAGSEDTEFDATLLVGGDEYRYGFSYNDREVTSEWLYLTKAETGQLTTLIERGEARVGPADLGSSVRARLRKYVGDIPADVLMLSFFGALDLGDEGAGRLRRVYDEIARASVLVGAGEGEDAEALLLDRFLKLGRGPWLNDLLRYLSEVDLSIRDIRLESRGGETCVLTYHLGADGALHPLDISDESAGTLKMLSLYTLLEGRAASGGLLALDELDAALHPLLQRFVVGRFHAGGAGGQLVFTSHDVSLLDRRYLRDDQVWFAEKDAHGVATLSSLADYASAPADYREAYLSGVFGAIPEIAVEEGGGRG